MRIISGSLKGRRIFAPSGLALRPTPDKVRGALFNILSDQVFDIAFLDLYAGTGAVGIEAASRGARQVTFVEQNGRHLQYLRKNLTTCKLSDQTTVYGIAAAHYLKASTHSFDLIFMDPPYESDEIEKVLPRLQEGDIIAKNGCLIIEHFHKQLLPEVVGEIHFLKKYRYGETVLSFYGKS